MDAIRNIVVPVDFSRHTEKLVDYALYMAGQLSATVHFIYASAFYAGDAMWGTPYVLEFKDKLDAHAQQHMDTLVGDAKGRYQQCFGQVIDGEPVETIVDFAKEKMADLIIISTHGAKGLEKILLGSVTERVLKRAHCPVLVMNPFKKT